MHTIAKLSLACVLVLLIGAPVQAQNPKQGDYYAPTQTPPQQASPGGQQSQGDYYKPVPTVPQGQSPAQQQQNQQGDYYKPGK